jgi:hypothetical protein
VTEAITLDVLKAQIAEAATSGDDAKLTALIREYNARKAETAKAIAAAAEAEAQKLAGVRAKLAGKIHESIVSGKPILDILVALSDVKATGFTFKVDEPDGVSYKAVALTVPVVKAAKAAKGTGGTHTTSKAEYGMTLDEIFQAHATAEDKAKLEAAEGNSAKWQVKNGVKKAAIAAGLLSPAK